MSIGLLADIHGNVVGLDAALGALSDADVDQIWVAGDIVGYYPYVNEVIERIRSRDCVCVAGNHDLALLDPSLVSPDQWLAYNLDYVDRTITTEYRDWLASLPTMREFVVHERRALLCHGSPWRVDEYMYADAEGWNRFENVDVDVVVLGHTHIPLVRRVGRTIVVNPGSCGQPRDYDPRASFAVLDLSDCRVSVQRVTYDLMTVQGRVRALGFDPRLVAILERTRLPHE